MGKTNTTEEASAQQARPELRTPLHPFVNHSVMLGFLQGILEVKGEITPGDWNKAVEHLWNFEAQ